MAKPMTAKQYVAQLDKWSVNHRAFKDGWERHNRTAATGKQFSNVNGVMLHHTGYDGSNLALLWNGYRELPGPLCHAAVSSKGLLWHVGWGYVNHAGSGDDDVLQKVISENYNGVLKPNETNTDGNARFYGVEVEYSGSHGMSHAQYSTMIVWAAAICHYHGWTSKSVIGHGEWQPGKWDPGYRSGSMMDMNAVRNDIQDLLEQKSTGTHKPNVQESRTFKAHVGDIIVIGGSELKVTKVQ